jgi:hypothetical protein
MAGDVWLADLARAFAAVPPGTDAEVRSITQLLGFDVSRRQDQEPPPLPPPPGPEELAWPEEREDAGGQVDRGEPARPAETADLPLLTPVGRQPVRAVGWGVKSLARVNASELGTLPDREPLLAPRAAAALLQTMSARNTAEGPLNVPVIVELLARGQVVEHLPRETRPTLRFGIQVLVDLGLPMRPFAGDQAQVVAQLRTVVGSHRTSVRYFSDAPGRGAGPGPRRTWRPYEPPERGTRVLVLSDFGLGGPRLYGHRGQPDEWRRLVADLRRQECDAVGLLPVPADRWPTWLSALMPLVCWDRTATAGKISASLRRS